MKILLVADLHLERGWFDWVAAHCIDYDLLVIAGDLQNAFKNLSMHKQARICVDWLISLQAPTVCCSGNHDFWVSDPRVSYDVAAEGRWLRQAKSNKNILAVDGDVVEFHGLKFGVNGWLSVPRFSEHIDVLITHAPPAGSPCARNGENHDNGDPGLLPAISNDPPALILCGHIHSPHKLVCDWPDEGRSSLVLVPGQNPHAVVPNHWVIDTKAGSATWFGEGEETICIPFVTVRGSKFL